MTDALPGDNVEIGVVEVDIAADGGHHVEMDGLVVANVTVPVGEPVVDAADGLLDADFQAGLLAESGLFHCLAGGGSAFGQTPADRVVAAAEYCFQPSVNGAENHAAGGYRFLYSGLLTPG